MKEGGEDLGEHGHIGNAYGGQESFLEVKKTKKVETWKEKLDVTVGVSADSWVLPKSQQDLLRKDRKHDCERKEEGCDYESTSIQVEAAKVS